MVLAPPMTLRVMLVVTTVAIAVIVAVVETALVGMTATPAAIVIRLRRAGAEAGEQDEKTRTGGPRAADAVPVAGALTDTVVHDTFHSFVRFAPAPPPWRRVRIEHGNRLRAHA